MEHIRIKSTDIFFKKLEDSKEKIIILNNDLNYSFSYCWTMKKGENLKQFVKSVSTDYFIGKLSNNKKNPINCKKTFTKLRTYLKENIVYELPWYEHLEFQKDFRKKLKEYQNTIYDDRNFIDEILAFDDRLDYYLIKDDNERKKIKSLFSEVFSNSEPWHFIEHNKNKEDSFLEQLHKTLKKELLKSPQLCLF